MSLLEKINELNELNENSLTFTKYSVGWEVGCYQDNSPLSFKDRKGLPRNQNLEDLIDEALEYSRKEKC